MKKHIYLDIPEPCHENWEKMTPSEQGRFCASCCKQVIDFTNMSDSQLAAFFKKPSTGSVCGRFMQDQLGRGIEIPRKRIPWIKYFFQFALPAFLMSAKATAQGGVMMLERDTTMVTPPVQRDGLVPTKLKNEIKGLVIDGQNNPVPFASIIIKGTSNGMEADSLGQFTISEEWYKKGIVLRVSSTGFTPTEVTVDENGNTKNLVVQLKRDAATLSEVVVQAREYYLRGMVLAGAVSIVTGETFYSNKKEELPEPAKMNTRIYPNPLSIGTSINIKCGGMEESTYLFQLLLVSGQVMMQKEIWIDKEAGVMNIQLPSVAAGVYILRMSDKKSGKQYSEKLIIQ